MSLETEFVTRAEFIQYVDKIIKLMENQARHEENSRSMEKILNDLTDSLNCINSTLNSLIPTIKDNAVFKKKLIKITAFVSALIVANFVGIFNVLSKIIKYLH